MFYSISLHFPHLPASYILIFSSYHLLILWHIHTWPHPGPILAPYYIHHIKNFGQPPIYIFENFSPTPINLPPIPTNPHQSPKQTTKEEKKREKKKKERRKKGREKGEKGGGEEEREPGEYGPNLLSPFNYRGGGRGRRLHLPQLIIKM